METTLNYDVNIDIIFTDEEFNLMDQAIKNDSQLAAHALIGNFWYGFTTSRPYYKEEPQVCTFSRRYVDTVLIKSIEMLAFYDNANKAEYYKLYQSLMDVLREAINRTAELNGLEQRV